LSEFRIFLGSLHEAEFEGLFLFFDFFIGLVLILAQKIVLDGLVGATEQPGQVFSLVEGQRFLLPERLEY
jgi:hypothetical protein